MKDLKDYTDIELNEEMKRRERVNWPKPLKEVNWTELIKQCEYYINHLGENGYESKDGDRHIYEIALSVIYGGDVWTWINEKMD